MIKLFLSITVLLVTMGNAQSQCWFSLTEEGWQGGYYDFVANTGDVKKYVGWNTYDDGSPDTGCTISSVEGYPENWVDSQGYVHWGKAGWWEVYFSCAPDCESQIGIEVFFNEMSYPVTGGGAICSGNTTTITLGNSQTGVSYRLVQGTTTLYGTAQAGIDGTALHWNVTSPGIYKIETHSSLLMQGSAIVTSISPPTIIETNTVSCLNQSNTYTTENGKTGYSWSVSGGTINSGVGTNSINVIWNSTGSQNISVNYAGCSTTTVKNVTVNPIPVPTFSQSPGATAAAYTNVSYATATGQSNYQWSIPGTINLDYQIISGGIGSNNSSVMLQWLTTGSKIVTVSYASPGGCASVTPASVTTVINVIVPTTPTSLAAIPFSPTQINLTWIDNSDNETGFQVERSTTPNTGFTIITTTSANVNTYGNTGLTSGTLYFYRVRAIANGAVSSYTPEVNGTTLVVPSLSETLNNFAFLYKYDTRRRMIAKKVPGAEWVYMVYDLRDRLILTQDGEQRKTNKWSYTKYDALNQPIITGIYTHTSPKNQEEMSALISTTNFYETYNGDNATQGYTDTVFPTSNFAAANFEPLTVTYYDNYQFRSNWTGSYTYTTDDLTATVATGTYTQLANNLENNNVKGFVTGVKVKVLDGNPSGTWLKTITYYDDKYRVIQTQSDNLKGGTDRASNLYDFVGKILKTKTTHVTTTTTQTIARSHEYDHAGRLLKTWHSVNNQAPVVLAANEYNELGQLVKKKLYNTDPASTNDAQRTFKQNVDYRYNIRGWLNSINDVSAPEVSDLFSMNLNYNNPTANGGTPQYNGNISEILWKGPDAKANSYGYSYDPMNRLTEAKYYNTTTPIQNGRFNEKIWDNVNNQSGYDLNGNIKFLSRAGKTGVTGGVTTYGSMDNLSYIYSGNQLLKVSDGDTKTQGFIDGANLDNDYAYDANGNMNVDKNKSITGVSTSAGNSNITYNYLNLPEKVIKSTGDYLKYTYDANGRKLKQEVYSPTSILKKKTDYAGEFFYENDTLKFINHEEGRIIMTGVPEYQYNLKDHLGNVRVTFTTKEETETNTATLENANRVSEGGKFLRYDRVRIINSSPIFDHTNGTANGSSIRLSGNANEKTGLIRSLSVMPGDVINMEVYAKYVDTNPENWNAAFVTLMNAVTTGSATAVTDGASYPTNPSNPFPYTGLNNTAGSTGAGPKAYLNYLVFDRDFNFILSQSDYTRLSSEPKEKGQDVAHERLEASVTIKQAGYVYIYLSNEEESPVEVYFDDFKVTQTKSPVVASNDYYPFGLTFNSYSRENSVKNKFKFQKQEHIDDLNLGWDSFKWRNHQPDIGRFFNIDPLADNYSYNSPYAFSENDVVNSVELEGLETFRVNFYSPMQSNEIIELLRRHESELLSDDIPDGKVMNEIMRIQLYGNLHGFVDTNGAKSEYIIKKLKEAKIPINRMIQLNKSTNSTKKISNQGDFITEFYGTKINSDGKVSMYKLGEINHAQSADRYWNRIFINFFINTFDKIFEFPDVFGPIFQFLPFQFQVDPNHREPPSAEKNKLEPDPKPIPPKPTPPLPDTPPPVTSPFN